MLIKDLLTPWLKYSGNETFNQLKLDSRNVSVGDIFVAFPGHLTDGRQYIDAAFKQGAVAALVHTDEPKEHGSVLMGSGTQIQFYKLGEHLSQLAALADPLGAERLKLVAITGTNGKTSISQLMAQLLSLLGKPVSVMGTLGNGLWGELIDSGNTTADAITIMTQLKDYDAQGAELCAMEVSSHGLVQGRVQAVPFDLAVFTNLSRDHLDYHGTMQAYCDAKRSLFDFTSLSAGLINIDDATGREWLSELNDPKHFGFSIFGDELEVQQRASFYTKHQQFHHQGVRATLVWPEGLAELDSPLLGAFNLSNLLAALSSLYLLGYDMQALVAAVVKLQPVPGRMERFTTALGVTLVVDYAHTPDALEQALTALRGHCNGDLWCLFGCGGDRDKGKRPLMARAAEAFSDKIMVTSDNARSESPEVIIAEILAGLKRPDDALTLVDRTEAIRLVVDMAKSGDIILLAGKGHETYQEIAGKRLDYDERALAAELAGCAA